MAPGSVAPLVSQRMIDSAPGLDRGAQAAQRVGGVGRVAVEEVLGVVEHALALGAQERHRLVDHAQVLVAIDAHDLVEVQVPGLADDRRDRREALGEHLQRDVLVSTRTPAARHPEGRDQRTRRRVGLERAEQLGILGVRLGEAGLDEGEAEAIDQVGEVDLLADGQRDALTLRAVTERRVVDADVVHRHKVYGPTPGAATRTPRGRARRRP